MELTKKQFDVLVAFEKEGRTLSQRELSEITGISLGSINRAYNELVSLNYIDSKGLTIDGLKVLEPYRVRRAIFVAAGFGSRLVPITLNTPKPLVRVNGTRIIETLLDAVVEAGIDEIIIVRGYLGEQFELLKVKYPNIKFVENKVFNEANNISSAMCVKDMLQNAYVLESDLLLMNKELITKYQYQSNFLGIKCDRTDDWCFKVKDGIIKEQLVGGEGPDIYQMVGISYWSAEDGKKLSDDIEKTYNMPGGHERYWDQVSLNYCKKNYNVAVRECKFSDIIEIDTLNELKAIDKTYDV